MAAPAKAGAIAPVDVFIPPQNTGLGPEKTSFFQALAIPTKISRGTIEILVRFVQASLSATSKQFTKNYCIPTSKAIKTYCSALFPSWSIIELEYFTKRRMSQMEIISNGCGHAFPRKALLICIRYLYRSGLTVSMLIGTCFRTLDAV